jgi:drug/metabolite transporter (DMT)-like permease
VSDGGNGTVRSDLAGRFAADGVLLAATFVWGATFVVVRDALADASPFLFVAVRFSLATLLLLPLTLRAGVFPDREAWRAGARVGVWLFLGFALQTLGLVGTAPARAAFLTGLMVVLVPVFSVVLYRVLPGPGALAGVALATAGLMLLTGLGRGRFTGYDLLVLGGAAAFALQILEVGRFARRIGAARLLLPELVVTALLAWPCALLLEAPRFAHTPALWSALLLTAALATTGALWAQNWAQRRTPPARAAVIFTLEPVFAAGISWVVTGERFGPAETAGAVLILAGMLAAELLPLRRAQRPGSAATGR